MFVHVCVSLALLPLCMERKDLVNCAFNSNGMQLDMFFQVTNQECVHLFVLCF